MWDKFGCKNDFKVNRTYQCTGRCISGRNIEHFLWSRRLWFQPPGHRRVYLCEMTRCWWLRDRSSLIPGWSLLCSRDLRVWTGRGELGNKKAEKGFFVKILVELLSVQVRKHSKVFLKWLKHYSTLHLHKSTKSNLNKSFTRQRLGIIFSKHSQRQFYFQTSGFYCFGKFIQSWNICKHLFLKDMVICNLRCHRGSYRRQKAGANLNVEAGNAGLDKNYINGATQGASDPWIKEYWLAITESNCYRQPLQLVTHFQPASRYHEGIYTLKVPSVACKRKQNNCVSKRITRWCYGNLNPWLKLSADGCCTCHMDSMTFTWIAENFDKISISRVIKNTVKFYSSKK